MKSRYFLTFLGILAGIFFLSPHFALAANRYWVGTDGANVNDTANWASADPASCTGGGVSVPSTSDVAIFDADCDSGANIDLAWSVAGIDMKTGYGGTVTQASGQTVTVGSSGWTVTGGIFTGGNSLIDINDSTLTINGGAWTNSSAGATMERSLTISSGTFTNTGSTITFDDNANNDNGTVTCTGSLGGTVAINKDSNGGITIAAGCSINLGASPTTTFGTGTNTNNGEMVIASGTWTIPTGTLFTNNGTIDHNGDGWNMTNLSTLANGATGIITYDGTTINLERSFNQSGTFDLTGKTLNFTDSGNDDDTTITCTGSLGGTVTVNKDASGDFIVATGCSVNLGASPTTTFANGTTTNNGEIVIPSGTWTVPSALLFTNNGTIDHNGDAWDMTNISTFTNGATGVITYDGTTINLERSFNQSGTFDLSGKTLNFTDSGNDDDTTITCTGSLGGTVTVNKDASGDFIVATGCSVNLGASPTTPLGSGTKTINGEIVVASGTWTITGSGTLTNNGTIDHNGDGWNMTSINLTNAGTFSFESGTTFGIVDGNLTNTGTITYGGTAISLERSLTQSGTFDLSGKTITFSDSSSADDTTVTCTGSLGGATVITKDSSGDFIVAAGCSINLGADPGTIISVGAANDFVINGEVVVPSGTWTITGSDGTVITNNGTIDHNGDGWTITDTSLTNGATGTITYDGATISMERSFTQSGTFDLTGKTITFSDSNSNDDTTFTCSGSLGGTVVITKDGRGDFIVSAGCSINLGADPTTTISVLASNDFVNNGEIVVASGTWVIAGDDGAIITNNGTIDHNGSDWTINHSILNNTVTGIITYDGTTLSLEQSLTQNGTFDLSGKTVTFADTNSSDDSTITCTGSLGGTTVITKDSAGDFVVAADCSVNLGADPSTTISTGAVNDFVNNGEIVVASGTWTIGGNGGTITNNGTIDHNGDGWVGTDTTLANTGTITYDGVTISWEGDFTQSGTFDLTGKTLTFNDTASNDDSTITCTGTLGGTVVITKDNDGDFIVEAGCEIDLGADPSTTISLGTNTNNGEIAIPSGAWNMDGGGDFTNNGTIDHAGDEWIIGEQDFTNEVGGTIAYAGTSICTEGIFTNNGTFDTTGITIGVCEEEEEEEDSGGGSSSSGSRKKIFSLPSLPSINIPQIIPQIPQNVFTPSVIIPEENIIIVPDKPEAEEGIQEEPEDTEVGEETLPTFEPIVIPEVTGEPLGPEEPSFFDKSGLLLQDLYIKSKIKISGFFEKIGNNFAKNKDPDPRLPEELVDHIYNKVTVQLATAEGRPMEGAHVTLLSEPKEATTDEGGQAIFYDVPTGEHTLLIAFGEFRGSQKLFLNHDAPDILVYVAPELRAGFSPGWFLVVFLAGILATLGIVKYMHMKFA